MSKIVCLFAFVALVQVATALECYSCDKTSCLEDMTKWQKTPACGKATASPTLTGACLKHVYTDKNTNKEVTIRKCAIAQKADDGKVSFTCSENEGKTVSCHVCTSELCNSATSVNFSFVTLLGVVAVYLIPKLM